MNTKVATEQGPSDIPRPVLVYQMGKVASRSLVAALEKLPRARIERSVGSALTMALLWLCVAVGLTGWAVQRSAQVGRLAAPPRYDDINYFNAALPWLHRWSELGPVDALLAFLQDPPRAPFPELLAPARSRSVGSIWPFLTSRVSSSPGWPCCGRAGSRAGR